MMITKVREDKGATDTVTQPIERLQASLRRYCLSLTESHWDAEDLAQDTWVKAMGTFKSLGHTNPEAFLLRIAKNTWIDQARRQSVWTHIVKSEQSKLSLDQQVSDCTFELEAAFQSLIKYLSPLQRAVFLLRDVLGYSNLEAASMLKTSEGAVKAALHRARQSLSHVRKVISNEVELPQVEADFKALLGALASAYQMGDIAALMALVQLDGFEPAVALGIVQNRRVKDVILAKRETTNSVTAFGLQMAA